MAATMFGEILSSCLCEDLKASEEDEIKVGQDTIGSKTNEFEALTSSLPSLRRTWRTQKLHWLPMRSFFVMLKENCSGTNAAWEESQEILVSLRWRRAARFWQS